VESLAALISALPPGLLPAGRLVSAQGGGEPVYWLSDTAGDADVWARLLTEHPRSGLWPLALHGLESEPSRPWEDGEVFPTEMTSPATHDVESVLARMWADAADDEGDEDADDEAERVAVIAPFEQWPGLAPPGEAQGSPDQIADRYARVVLDGSARLGLVAAGRGADALATVGWSGPTNYAETGKISAVVRSWEDRFGVRVVGVGFDTLRLSLAAPPTTLDQALPIAAEHFAFCPDNVWQAVGSVAAYAEELVGADSWTFWWD
jgi:Domain of unknown function (DUF4253)